MQLSEQTMRTLIALVLFVFTDMASAQANYTKTAEIPPLRVSFTALQAVLDKTEKLVASANSGVKPQREELVLKAGAVRVTIPGRTLAPLNAKVPEQIEFLSYTYSTLNQSPVTRVDFDFSDYRRTLTVEGPSPEQVDAIFAAIREDLIALSSTVGGSGIKTMLGFPTYWLLMLIFGWSGSDWYSRRSQRSLATAAATASALLLLLVLPTGDLLAGFLAIRGEPSFMIRYGPEMSFIGLILTVIGIPFTVLQLLRPRDTKPTEM
jgi:hypothetical protein